MLEQWIAQHFDLFVHIMFYPDVVAKTVLILVCLVAVRTGYFDHIGVLMLDVTGNSPTVDPLLTIFALSL